MHYVAPLIGEAWEQHHRRRARLLVAAGISVLVAAVIWWTSGGLGMTTGDGASVSSVNARPSAVLARSPYMGIAVCHPSSSTCYRVGLAVWLKRPARSVTAMSSGVSVSLNRTDRSGIQMISFVRRREFIGFFEPAGIVPRASLRTPDASPRSPIAAVTLTINTGHGQTLITRLRVPVQAGWG
jgi:hypothetical protein